MSADMSQVGATVFFPFKFILYNFSFPGFPFILMFVGKVLLSDHKVNRHLGKIFQPFGTNYDSNFFSYPN